VYNFCSSFSDFSKKTPIFSAIPPPKKFINYSNTMGLVGFGWAFAGTALWNAILLGKPYLRDFEC